MLVCVPGGGNLFPWGWSWYGGWTNREVLREREREEGAYESCRVGQHSRHHRTIPG